MMVRGTVPNGNKRTPSFQAERRPLSLNPTTDALIDFPLFRDLFLIDLRRIRSSVVAQCCTTHAMHQAYMRAAANSRARIQQRFIPFSLSTQHSLAA
jgi:hypothetical protein